MIIAAYVFLYLLIGFLVACYDHRNIRAPDDTDAWFFALTWVIWPVTVMVLISAFALKAITKLR